MKGVLADWVKPRMRDSRSVNVERHQPTLGGDGTAPYIPTGRALEAIDRIVTALETPEAPRSWTITGPYGSGKSAFAAFLAALLGPAAQPATAQALATLTAATPRLAGRLQTVRQQLGAESAGFILAMATAQREPATNTVVRALQHGAQHRWTGRGGRPAVVKRLLSLAEQQVASPSGAVGALEEVLARGPLLLVLDEFGKNLEYSADDPAGGDLFILQQIAERLAGPGAPTGVFITFQHLSFTDYAYGLPAARLQEWNKVQGRFEDLSFLEAHDQTAQLIRAAISVEPPTAKQARLLQLWANTCADSLSRLDLTSLVIPDPAQLAGSYPLHPLVLAVLPELTARYGQRERSLFSFITGDQPHSLPAFLTAAAPTAETLPVLGLDGLYDFFIDAAPDIPTGSGTASRWIEIRSRLREAQGLNAAEQQLLKTVGVLNLVGSGGPLRASRDLLDFALSGSASLDTAIRSLESRGLVTFRSFADEYRVWEGSDVDLPAAVAAERDRTQTEDLNNHLIQALPPAPRVAQRHSLKTGTLRFFESRYLSGRTSLGELTTSADGLLIYLLGTADPTGRPPISSDGKPVIYAATPDYLRIREAAVEAAALTRLLETNSAVRQDRVALQEARHRASTAQEVLRRRLATAFDPSRADVTWVARGHQVTIDGSRHLAALVSDLCDEFYPAGPSIRNEMLNRQQLTSQGAKARRQLLEALIEHTGRPTLGIRGYGPERAMYESVLRATGLHRVADGAARLAVPDPGTPFAAAWDWVLSEFRNQAAPVSLGAIQEGLIRPPFGMRLGPIPVLLTAILITHADDLAIYQDGSFEPVLTIDLVERMIKIPERFTVRHTHTSGTRAVVVDALRAALDVPELPAAKTLRNATLLAVLRPIVASLRSVPEYGMRTRQVSEAAQRLRDALTSVREPDDLLFETLPRAVGIPGFPPGMPIPQGRATEYGRQVADALLELLGAYPGLLDTIAGEISTAFGVPREIGRLREDLRTRSRHLAEQVLDQRLRSFLLFAVNEELGDTEWLEALAMNLTGKPPRSWRDSDLSVFRLRLNDLMATFRRVELLYYERLNVDAIEGFSARRLTLTTPDGSEAGRVIWIDDRDRDIVIDLVHNIVQLTDERLGIDARPAVLAALAEHIMCQPQADNTAQDPASEPERGVGDG